MCDGLDAAAVVALLVAEIAAHRSDKAWGTAWRWGQDHGGISSCTISSVLHGSVVATPKVAAALGLRREWRFFPIGDKQ